jgi:FkbM family methyltransferase
MQDNSLKKFAKFVFFRQNSIRRIRFGPLRGMVYRVDDITGLSPWYSGSEREHQRVFKSLVNTGDLVIDVGANWGLHTLYLSRLVGPTGLVLAYEPFPNAIQVLEWHLDANGCRNVKIMDKAASDQDGAAVFSIGGSAQTGGLTENLPSPAGLQQLTVRTERLDSTRNDLPAGRVKLIKIDVEGAETKVLLGAKSLIAEHRPFLVVDLHTPEQDVSVGRLLSDWHYRITRLSGAPILHIDRGWPDPEGIWGTILASPSDAENNENGFGDRSYVNSSEGQTSAE